MHHASESSVISKNPRRAIFRQGLGAAAADLAMRMTGPSKPHRRIARFVRAPAIALAADLNGSSALTRNEEPQADIQQRPEALACGNRRSGPARAARRDHRPANRRVRIGVRDRDPGEGMPRRDQRVQDDLSQ